MLTVTTPNWHGAQTPPTSTAGTFRGSSQINLFAGREEGIAPESSEQPCAAAYVCHRDYSCGVQIVGDFYPHAENTQGTVHVWKEWLWETLGKMKQGIQAVDTFLIQSDKGCF